MPALQPSRWIAPQALLSAGLLALLLLALGLLVWALGSRSQQTAAILFFGQLTGVLALTMFSGASGVLSFGHVAFMALGAQIGASLTMPPALKASALPDLPDLILTSQGSLLEATLLALILVLPFALLTGLPIARLNGASAVIATLGLLIITHALIIGSRGITRGAEAMTGVPRLATLPVALGVALGALLLARLWRDALPGLMLRAVREDEAAAASIGLRADRARLLGWMLSAGVGTVAGVVMAHQLGVFSAKNFYFSLTLTLIVMQGVGSATGVSGAIAGSLAVTLLMEVLRRVERGVDLGLLEIPPVFGVTEGGLSILILLILYARPAGLLGDRELRLPASPVSPPPAAPPVIREPGPPPPQMPASERPALSVEHLGKAYGGVRALQDVAFSLGQGQILGLIGPNGSGKSTLLGCIAGTHRPDQGRILLAGTDRTGAASWQIARLGVGRSFQTSRVFARLSVTENLLAALALRHRDWSRPRLEAAADALLRDLDLADRADQPAGTLAYGLQRRLEIARALALDPWLLLLDEPAAGLNEAESCRLMALLRRLVAERGLSLILVDHDMALIMALCPRLIVLHQGRIIADGDPEQIRNHPAVREAYLGRRAGGRPFSPPPGADPAASMIPA